MAVNKTISVWLVIIDGENKGKIPLQKRSVGEQAFHYVCQATWAGKVEPEESTEAAIKRECREELGKDFFEKFNFSKLKLLSEINFIAKERRWVGYNYLGKIRSSFLEDVKLHNEAFPNFVFIGNMDKIYSVKSGKDPKNNIVLFDDQYKILKKLLR